MNNRAGPRAPRPAASTRAITAMQAAVAAELDDLGLTTREILRRLATLAEATKTLVAQKDGEFTDTIEVPDNPTRKSAIDTMLHLRQAFPATRLEVGGVLRVEQLHEIALRLDSLSPERLAEIIESEDAVLALPSAEREEPTEPTT